MAAKTSMILVTFLFVFLIGSAPQAFAFASKSAPAAASETEATSSSVSSYSGPTVWVTRPDGAQQCAPGSGQSLESSSSELQKNQVHVLSSQKGGDKKLRAQMCGIPSGKTNMFQIPKEDLPKAIALGFHEVKE
jgi:hypothetical protein